MPTLTATTPSASEGESELASPSTSPASMGRVSPMSRGESSRVSPMAALVPAGTA
jgi:hypothetical protein